MDEFLLLTEIVEIRRRVEELVRGSSAIIVETYTKPRKERGLHVARTEERIRVENMRGEYQNLFLRFCEIAFEHFHANGDPTGIRSACHKWGEMVRIAKHKGSQSACRRSKRSK